MPGTASQVVPPVKTADFKLMVSTNREAVQVLELFGDLVRQVGWWCRQADSASKQPLSLGVSHADPLTAVAPRERPTGVARYRL